MQEDYYRLTIVEKKKFWEDHIRCWRESGLNQTGYCKHSGIKSHLWFYWKRELGKAETSVTFIPLRLPTLTGNPQSQSIRVITPNGFRIEIENPASLQQLIRDVAAI